jgi:hypothetical protein
MMSLSMQEVPFFRSKIVLFWEISFYRNWSFSLECKTRHFHLCSIPCHIGGRYDVARHKICKWVRVIKLRAIPDVHKYLHSHINIQKHKKEMDGCRSDKEATPVGVPPAERSWSADADLFLILLVLVFVCMQIRQ